MNEYFPFEVFGTDSIRGQIEVELRDAGRYLVPSGERS